MAEAQKPNDFQAVLDTVWEDLEDEMNLDSVLEELKRSKVFRGSKLRDIGEKYQTTTEKIGALLQLVKDGERSTYDHFKRCLRATEQGHLVDSLDAVERGEPKHEMRKKPRTAEEQLLEVLKEDLLFYYMTWESTMPVAPLVEHHEAQLTEFYVKPPMMAYNKLNAYGQQKRPQEQSKGKQDMEKRNEKTPIRSYKEMLFNEGHPYKGIYVTAEAGMGKTSFAKMIAVTWCQAHSQAFKERVVAETSEMLYDDGRQASKDDKVENKGTNSYQNLESEDYLCDVRSNTSSDNLSGAEDGLTETDDDTSFDTDDILTLKTCDFLFLIQLREYEKSDKCSLEDMILEMLKSKLTHKSRYTEEFLEKVLCTKQCLIIVHGLDEWIHPQTCTRRKVIPHRREWRGCSVLTTTRPWKLSTAGLSTADIDRHVEISQLDTHAAHKLIIRAVKFLNKNWNQNNQMADNNDRKKPIYFQNIVAAESYHKDILCIPYVLLQRICLWFNNSPIGKSMSEVYSNIIELTLTRWLAKTDSGHIICKCLPSPEHENVHFNCMENNTHCKCYMPLLLKIGQLAFLNLFCLIREESLLFDREQVIKSLTEEDMKLCLEMGLLSQVKDTTSLTKVSLQLSFPHKTIQEYFSGLFVAASWNNNDSQKEVIKQTISSKCRSVSDILEMSKVFMFVCGLNPEAYSDISRHLSTIVATDQRVIDFRRSLEVSEYGSEYQTVLEYQQMQIEIMRDEHVECKIVLEHFIFNKYRMLDDELKSLTKILSDNTSNVKSLIYRHDQGYNMSDIIHILGQSDFPCLESLRIQKLGERVPVPPFLLTVLTTAAAILKYLELRGVIFTDESISAMSCMNNLLCLNLTFVTIPTVRLDLPRLSQLRLVLCDLKDSIVTLSPEMTNPETIMLDKTAESISCWTELLLSISKLPLKYLELNGIRISDKSIIAISRMNSLFHLRLWNVIIPTVRLDLPQLSQFTLERCDLEDSIVTLSPEMTSLETIKLFETTMSLPCWRELFLSISKLPLKYLQLYDVSLPEESIIAISRMDSLLHLNLTLVTIPTVRMDLSRLTQFILTLCNLHDSTVTLSAEMTSLETIQLTGTTMSIPCCRELFLSISKLPQPITVMLDHPRMTAGGWRELLFDILGKLPKSIHVVMWARLVPSSEEWRNIIDFVKMSPAFRVTTSSESYVDFETLVREEDRD